MLFIFIYPQAARNIPDPKTLVSFRALLHRAVFTGAAFECLLHYQ